MKEQAKQLNQLNFLLNDEQKKGILNKHERIKNILLRRGIFKTDKGIDNYSKYNELNDYEKYILVGNNYWVIMNGEYNRFISVPINDLHFWYYFNEKCFELCDKFQKGKKIENEELYRQQQEYKTANIEAIVHDNIEPIKKIIEIVPDVVISETKKDSLDLNAEIVIPEIKKVEQKKSGGFEKNILNNKNIKKENNSDQIGLF